MTSLPPPELKDRLRSEGFSRRDALDKDWRRNAARRIATRVLALPELRDLEPVGGAVPLDSPFYVVRRTDEEFRAAIARRDSIVLVKGPREVGKTSLLARGPVSQFRGSPGRTRRPGCAPTSRRRRPAGRASRRA